MQYDNQFFFNTLVSGFKFKFKKPFFIVKYTYSQIWNKIYFNFRCVFLLQLIPMIPPINPNDTLMNSNYKIRFCILDFPSKQNFQGFFAIHGTQIYISIKKKEMSIKHLIHFHQIPLSDKFNQNCKSVLYIIDLI